MHKNISFHGSILKFKHERKYKEQNWQKKIELHQSREIGFWYGRQLGAKDYLFKVITTTRVRSSELCTGTHHPTLQHKSISANLENIDWTKKTWIPEDTNVKRPQKEGSNGVVITNISYKYNIQMVNPRPQWNQNPSKSKKIKNKDKD